MQAKLDGITAALRVLRAVNQHRRPEETDIHVLRAYAPLLDSRPPDELACEVIQRLLGTHEEILADNAKEVSEVTLPGGCKPSGKASNDLEVKTQ
ncbi:MAG: hypothetical protein WBY44_36560 [Bryobacteraceae bacterium]